MNQTPETKVVVEDRSHKSPLLPYTWSDNTRVTVTVGFALLIIGAIFAAGMNISLYQTRVEASEKAIGELQQKQEKNEADNIQMQIKLSEIQTTLKSVDATLTEIKQNQSK